MTNSILILSSIQFIILGLIIFFYIKIKNQDNGKLEIKEFEEKITKLEQHIFEKITASANDNHIKLIDTLAKNKDETMEKFSKINENISSKLFEIEEKSNEKMNSLTDQNFKQMNTILKEFNIFQKTLMETLTDNIEKINKNQTDNFSKLTNKVEERLDIISGNVNQQLETGFKKTNETFVKITERLVKIDEAQKKIEELTTNVNSLQNILTDKKTRGIFGEVQLNQILNNIFGEKNSRLFDIQYKMNNVIADAVVFLPEPHGLMAIDSKFPLESYKKMYDETLDSKTREDAKKLFKINVKKHITDIAEKYIIPHVTADVAVMFIPAEAIFAEIYAYHEDLVDYAISKNIWMCSPTTLIGVLTTIQAVIRDIETGKQAKVIQEELSKLAVEFQRYHDRWQKLTDSIDKVTKNVKDVSITSTKISKKFESIKNVDFEQIEDKNLLNKLT